MSRKIQQQFLFSKLRDEPNNRRQFPIKITQKKIEKVNLNLNLNNSFTKEFTSMQKENSDEDENNNLLAQSYNFNQINKYREKILNEPQANKIVYTSRFCILTKKYFAYYKSKESYISLNKPMLIIEKEDIIRIENTFLEGEGYFGIVCEVNDKTRNLIDKVNSFVTNDENGSQLLLGFRSNKYEDMANWILMLNYFISEQNMAV